jgi:hypothetical protein
MDKIVVKSDMTIVDGNQRFAAAVSSCQKLSDFKFECTIAETGKDGIIIFDTKLQRFIVKEKYPTLFLIRKGLTKVFGIVDSEDLARRWVNALNAKDGEDEYEQEAFETGEVAGFKKLVPVNIALYDLHTNTISQCSTIEWPSNDESFEEILYHQTYWDKDIYFDNTIVEMGRKAKVIASTDRRIDEVYSRAKTAFKNLLDECKRRIQLPVNGSRLFLVKTNG